MLQVMNCLINASWLCLDMSHSTCCSCLQKATGLHFVPQHKSDVAWHICFFFFYVPQLLIVAVVVEMHT